MTDEVVNEPVDEPVEEGTPAIFLRKVPVYIQDGDDEEPRLVSAGEEPAEQTEE